MAKLRSSRPAGPSRGVKTDSLGRKLSEAKIQSQILYMLKKAGIFHWRQNAGVIKAGAFRVRLGPKGIPDIIVLLPPTGRFMGLEVKRKGTYQNPDQKAFQARIEAVGGMYHVVRSKEEAWKVLLQAGCNISMGRTGKSKKKEVSQLDPWKY